MIQNQNQNFEVSISLPLLDTDKSNDETNTTISSTSTSTTKAPNLSGDQMGFEIIDVEFGDESPPGGSNPNSGQDSDDGPGGFEAYDTDTTSTSTTTSSSSSIITTTTTSTTTQTGPRTITPRPRHLPSSRASRYRALAASAYFPPSDPSCLRGGNGIINPSRDWLVSFNWTEANFNGGNSTRDTGLDQSIVDMIENERNGITDNNRFINKNSPQIVHPGQSRWVESARKHEEKVFLAQIRHQSSKSIASDPQNHKAESYTVRLGAGGANMYSYVIDSLTESSTLLEGLEGSKDDNNVYHDGEIFASQYENSAFIDQSLMPTLIGHDVESDWSNNYIQNPNNLAIYGSGSYQKSATVESSSIYIDPETQSDDEKILKDNPNYTNTLAGYCEGVNGDQNLPFCSFIGMPVKAILPSLDRSYKTEMQFYSRYRPCDDGVMEVTYVLRNEKQMSKGIKDLIAEKVYQVLDNLRQKRQQSKRSIRSRALESDAPNPQTNIGLINSPRLSIRPTALRDVVHSYKYSDSSVTSPEPGSTKTLCPILDNGSQSQNTPTALISYDSKPLSCGKDPSKTSPLKQAPELMKESGGFTMFVESMPQRISTPGPDNVNYDFNSNAAVSLVSIHRHRGCKHNPDLDVDDSNKYLIRCFIIPNSFEMKTNQNIGNWQNTPLTLTELGDYPDNIKLSNEQAKTMIPGKVAGKQFHIEGTKHWRQGGNWWVFYPADNTTAQDYIDWIKPGGKSNSKHKDISIWHRQSQDLNNPQYYMNYRNDIENNRVFSVAYGDQINELSNVENTDFASHGSTAWLSNDGEIRYRTQMKTAPSSDSTNTKTEAYSLEVTPKVSPSSFQPGNSFYHRFYLLTGTYGSQSEMEVKSRRWAQKAKHGIHFAGQSPLNNDVSDPSQAGPERIELWYNRQRRVFGAVTMSGYYLGGYLDGTFKGSGEGVLLQENVLTMDLETHKGGALGGEQGTERANEVKVRWGIKEGEGLNLGANSDDDSSSSESDSESESSNDDLPIIGFSQKASYHHCVTKDHTLACFGSSIPTTSTQVPYFHVSCVNYNGPDPTVPIGHTYSGPDRYRLSDYFIKREEDDSESDSDESDSGSSKVSDSSLFLAHRLYACSPRASGRTRKEADQGPIVRPTISLLGYFEPDSCDGTLTSSKANDDLEEDDDDKGSDSEDSSDRFSLKSSERYNYIFQEDDFCADSLLYDMRNTTTTSTTTKNPYGYDNSNGTYMSGDITVSNKIKLTVNFPEIVMSNKLQRQRLRQLMQEAVLNGAYCQSWQNSGSILGKSVEKCVNNTVVNAVWDRMLLDEILNSTSSSSGNSTETSTSRTRRRLEIDNDYDGKTGSSTVPATMSNLLNLNLDVELDGNGELNLVKRKASKPTRILSSFTIPKITTTTEFNLISTIQGHNSESGVLAKDSISHHSMAFDESSIRFHLTQRYNNEVTQTGSVLTLNKDGTPMDSSIIANLLLTASDIILVKDSSLSQSLEENLGPTGPVYINSSPSGVDAESINDLIDTLIENEKDEEWMKSLSTTMIILLSINMLALFGLTGFVIWMHKTERGRRFKSRMTQRVTEIRKSVVQRAKSVVERPVTRMQSVASLWGGKSMRGSDIDTNSSNDIRENTQKNATSVKSHGLSTHIPFGASQKGETTTVETLDYSSDDDSDDSETSETSSYYTDSSDEDSESTTDTKTKVENNIPGQVNMANTPGAGNQSVLKKEKSMRKEKSMKKEKSMMKKEKSMKKAKSMKKQKSMMKQKSTKSNWKKAPSKTNSKVGIGDTITREF